LECPVLTTKTDTIAFHKEGLFNKAFSVYKDKYNCFVLCDGDIIFYDNDWAKKTIACIDSGHDVLQPYSICNWTDKNESVYSSRLSFTSFRNANKSIAVRDLFQLPLRGSFHSGFAWAFSKSFLEKSNGLFSKAFSGSGDSIVTFLAEGVTIEEIESDIVKNLAYLQPHVNEFLKLNKKQNRIGNIDGMIQHLYHGSESNRQYNTRHQKMNSRKITLDSENFSENLNDYLIQATNSEINKIMLEYFQARKDDD